MSASASLATDAALPCGAAPDLETVARFNSTDAAFPDHATVQEIIEARVAANPQAIAVVCDHDTTFGAPSLTYAEVNEKANQLAHLLRAEGVGPGQVVALAVERSFAMMIGILGVVKAGAAYLPVAPDTPPERADHMVKASWDGQAERRRRA